MTLLATAKRQAGGAWQSLGFTLAYPWFKFIEWQTNYKYRGNGEFVNIERGAYTDYKRGEIAARLGALPSFGYLAISLCVYALDVPLLIVPVALCFASSAAVWGEVTVRTLGGDGR